MKLFIDTANDMGILDGVTTSLTKEGIMGEAAIMQHYQTIFY